MRRIAILPLILIGSCQQASIESASLVTPSCKSSLPLAPDIAPRAAWVRTPFKVNPRGVYTFRHPVDTQATVATEIDIVRELKLMPGDYVGLQSFGKWFWGSDTSPSGSTSNELIAVFVDSAGHFLAPASAGEEEKFVTQPTYNGNIATDIAEDFRVPADAETIVRFPQGAVKLLLQGSDSYYGDNSVAGEFGVMVFEPNTKSGEPTTLFESDIGGTAQAEMFSATEVQGQFAVDPPEATGFAASPFAGAASADTTAQWRGNYGGMGWIPLRSTYAGLRNNGRHWGWDLFSPKGTPLVAPVWPSLMIATPKSDTFGNTVAFAFKYHGKKYLIGYAHLDRIEGDARKITGPEVVAYSGCTGSSVEKLGCGSRYETGAAKGMRNDHVHVGLYSDQAVNPVDFKACNPGTVLNWLIR